MTIALLTDFGITDIYVGVMKGVMQGINPGAPMIDITHGIEPQNVRQAAIALMNAYRYFPAGTTFLVVVDPGVGSTRRPIAVQAGDYRFVAPDNGVISYTIARIGSYQAVELTHEDDTSFTFHGRDIFAPAAARLARGDALTDVGDPIDRIVSLPQPQLDIAAKNVVGEIVHIDHFGNLVTSIGHLRWITSERLTLLSTFGNAENVPVSGVNAAIKIGGQTLTGIRQTYSEAERGGLLALVGSSGFLEISVNQGSAAARLDVQIGDRVELQAGETHAAVLD